jgi:hypothetical protein
MSGAADWKLLDDMFHTKFLCKSITIPDFTHISLIIHYLLPPNQKPITDFTQLPFCFTSSKKIMRTKVAYFSAITTIQYQDLEYTLTELLTPHTSVNVPYYYLISFKRNYAWNSLLTLHNSVLLYIPALFLIFRIIFKGQCKYFLYKNTIQERIL